MGIYRPNTPTQPDNKIGKLIGYILSVALILISVFAGPPSEPTSPLVDILTRSGVAVAGLGLAWMTAKHKEEGGPPDIT